MTAVDVSFAVEDLSRGGLEHAAGRLAGLGLASAWVAPNGTAAGEPDALDALEHAAAGVEGLHLLPVVAPVAGRPGTFARAVRIAESAPCRAVRVCPDAHGYPLVDWVLSPLPELCARHRVAIVLDFGGGPVPWRDVVALGRAHPAVPLVALGARVDRDRTVPAVLDATANVVVELSEVDDVEDAAALVRLLGPHRFVWGSAGSPAAAAQRPALEAALGDEAAPAVLGDNARALVDGTYVGRFL